MTAKHVRPRRAVVLSESLESRVLFVRVEGIDVSQFQGVINWPQVAANGKQFVFMRASRTNLEKDPTFETNLAGATAAGLLVGTYHYTLPRNVANAGPPVDPVLDAQKYFAAAGHTMTTGFLPPVIDAEFGGEVMGKTEYSKWINAFSDEIFRLSGVRPIVYANINYAVNFIDESVASRHKLWLARYNNGNNSVGLDPQTIQPDLASFHPNPYGSWNKPVGGPRSDDSWRFWQYTSTGPGLAVGVSSTNLDLNLYNGSYEELRKEFLIGYQKNFGTDNNNPFAVGPGITTTIEAEAYDIGGEGVSYHDLSSDTNTGGGFRDSKREGVDVSPIVDGAGTFRLSDTTAGEFVEYTIDVSAAGSYQLDYLLSQTDPGAAMHAEIDGVPLATVTVPDTENVNSFATVSQTATLSAGQHVIRLAFDGAAANGTVAGVDKLVITQAPATPVPEQPPAGSKVAGDAAYVRGGSFGPQNFAFTSDLVVQRGKGTANTFYSYLKFDLGNVSSISSAKLRLVGRLSDSAVASLRTGVYSVGPTKTSLTEGALTFKNKPAGKKLRGFLNVTGTSNAAYELDLTSFLQAELAAGRKTVTLVLKNVTKSVTTQAVFGSDESGNPPALVLA